MPKADIEPNHFDLELDERLQAIEAALKLQMELGTSHLQAVEIAPRSFGLDAALRPAVKSIRMRRNAALHVFPHVSVKRMVQQAEATGAGKESSKAVGKPPVKIRDECMGHKSVGTVGRGRGAFSGRAA